MSQTDLLSYRLSVQMSDIKYVKVIEIEYQSRIVRYIDVRLSIRIDGRDMPTVRGVFLKPEEFSLIIGHMSRFEEHFLISELRMVWFRSSRYYPNVFELIIREDLRENKIILFPNEIIQLYIMRDLLLLKCYN